MCAPPFPVRGHADAVETYVGRARGTSAITVFLAMPRDYRISVRQEAGHRMGTFPGLYVPVPATLSCGSVNVRA